MPHSTLLLRATAVLAALIFAGCSKPPDFTIKLDSPGVSGDFTHYKLVVDGAPVGPFTAVRPFVFSAPGHRASKPRDMLPRVEASVLSVCGWEPAKVQMSAPSEGEIERAGKEKRVAFQPMRHVLKMGSHRRSFLVRSAFSVCPSHGPLWCVERSSANA